MDIGWLQRDFGLYVVNMFDTGQATRVLEYPRFSLAFLLKKFCDVTADKQYQLADWRIRPLPSEMVLYAREDTHYLLYVYDRLRNELISKGNIHNNLLESVYKRSKAICLKTYEKPIFTSESYLALYHRHKKSLNPNQLEAFRLLYAWRDEMARLEDESYAYVLPNHMLFGIAEVLPKAPQGVLACCNPVPSLVRQNINVIHHLVVQARDLDPKLKGPTTPTRSSMTRNGQASGSIVNMDVRGVVTSVEKQKSDDTKMKCEGMTAFKKYPITGPAVRIAKPKISLFACRGETKVLSEGEKKATVIQESFKNPFQAFLPAKKPDEILNKKSSEEINQQWKTKSEEIKKTTKTADEEGTMKTEDETRKRKHESSLEKDEDNEEEEDVPLREPKKKKEKNEKGNKTPQVNLTSKENSQFVPFDYSSANLDFAGKDVGQKKEIFNPYNKMTEKTKRFSSKVHMKSGERSMTFSKKK